MCMLRLGTLIDALASADATSSSAPRPVVTITDELPQYEEHVGGREIMTKKP